MKKLLLILCITMNLICMMLAVYLFMMTRNGYFDIMIMGAAGGTTLNPTMVMVVLILLALLFAYLATRLAVGKK